MLVIGCEGSPPTTIIGDLSARAMLDGDSGPNGLMGLDAVGLGGGASLRETGGSEPEGTGTATSGRELVGSSSSTTIGSSPSPG